MANKQAGPVLTLCPVCKSIQKADSVCSICKAPIPPKRPAPEEKPEDDKDHVAKCLRILSDLLDERCPLCDALVTDPTSWRRFVTEPGSRDHPEWVEYICPNCAESIEEAKLERQLEQLEQREAF